MNTRNHLLLTALGAAQLLTAQTPVWDNACHPDQRETYAVAFSNDGMEVLSASECDNAHARLWESTSGNMVWDTDIGSTLFCLMGAQFSADGSHFAVMEELGTVLIYDYSGPTPVLAHVIDMGISASYSLDFSPDGTKLVADGTGGTLRIYDVVSGALVQSIPGNMGTVFTVDYSPDGTLIAAGSQDNNVRLWNAADGTLAATLSGHTGDLRSVKFNTAGDHIVTASVNGEVKLWMKMMNMWMVHGSFNVGENIHQVDISDDNAYIIVGGYTTTHVFESMSGNEVATFNVANGGDVWSVDFKPGGHDAVTGTGSGRVVYWALEDFLGTAEHEPLHFEAFPNPVIDALNLTVPDAHGTTRVEVFTTGGQRVLTTVFNGQRGTVDLGNAAAGDYLLHITNGGRSGIRSINKPLP